MVQAKNETPRILENEAVKLTLSVHEREIAEPASQPKEVRVKAECKKGYVQKNKEFVVKVCSADLSSAEFTKDKLQVTFSHYNWDAAPSSKNMEGQLFCDTNTPIKDFFPISAFCTKK
jgi:hypothetical protein